MKKKTLLILGLAWVFGTLFAQDQKLIVDYITSPQYSQESVIIVVIVRNVGENSVNQNFDIKVSDADISYNDAKKLKKNGTYVYPLSKQEQHLAKLTDVEDEYWEVKKEVKYPDISPNESIAFEVNLGDYWPYDPNVDIKVQILPTEEDLQFIREELKGLEEDFPDKTEEGLMRDLGMEVFGAEGYIFAGG